MTKPFLKWAGGKQWLADALADRIPVDGGRYIEPFVGGGAVFFALAPKQALLADANEELIAAYRGVRDSVEQVIQLLSSYPHDIAFFKRLRISRPRSDAERAARLVYLNKTAFNGLYRVNRAGDFNVPFGSYKNPGICQPDRLRAASCALAGVDLLAQDFDATLRTAKAGDTVYLDPPYITSHTENGFLKYNAHLFSWNDQLRLARSARRLVTRGVAVFVSNADFRPLLRHYPGFTVERMDRLSPIAGSAGNRHLVREVLISSDSMGA